MLYFYLDLRHTSLTDLASGALLRIHQEAGKAPSEMPEDLDCNEQVCFIYLPLAPRRPLFTKFFVGNA